MSHRIAASLALIAFAVSVVISGIHAGNSFSTTVWRALLAMGGTYLIGLVVGTMAQKMLDENLRVEEENLRNSRNVQPNDR